MKEEVRVQISYTFGNGKLRGLKRAIAMQTKKRVPIDRDAAIAMWAEGHTLQEVGNAFGVTRERIRQIVESSGAKRSFSISSRKRQLRFDEATKMLLNGSSVREIESRLGVSRNKLRGLRSILGMPVGRGAIQEHRKILWQSAIEAVAGGMSIRKAEDQYGIPRNRLSYLLRKIGIKSNAKSRWRDLSYRYDLIPQMLTQGATWDEIRHRCEEVEGVSYKGRQTFYNWAKKHLRSSQS